MKRMVPRHVGFIPDGNRRWALERGLSKEDGYQHGIAPGLELFEKCRDVGIEEISIYGFTKDNTKRPSVQKMHFIQACVEFARQVKQKGAALLVVGDAGSRQFPAQLKPYLVRSSGDVKVNLLANYGWDWDLEGIAHGGLRSQEVSRLDLIVRWGGGRRLSGFLPVQSVYADFYVVDDYWPDFDMSHFDNALAWFRQQDQTLGG